MPTAAVEQWRHVFAVSRGGALESTVSGAQERIERARATLEQIVRDRFGGDRGLLDQVHDIALTAEEAVAILEEGEGTAATEDHYGALEAIVAFDGSRPCFLVKQNQVDFDSSFNTGDWIFDLKPYLDSINTHLACTGRVERGQRLIGTAFLVTPTLAITNRHVAQSIATFAGTQAVLKPECYLDFGREYWNDHASFDRRKIEAVAFAGAAEIVAPIDHSKLDLAVLRVSPSTLGAAEARRNLRAHAMNAHSYAETLTVATCGFPADPDAYAPKPVLKKYDKVLQRLMEGDGGSKRFAPGAPALVDIPKARWTVGHGRAKP